MPQLEREWGPMLVKTAAMTLQGIRQEVYLTNVKLYGKFRDEVVAYLTRYAHSLSDDKKMTVEWHDQSKLILKNFKRNGVDRSLTVENLVPRAFMMLPNPSDARILVANEKWLGKYVNLPPDASSVKVGQYILEIANKVLKMDE